MNALARIQGLLRRTIGLDPTSLGDRPMELVARRRLAASGDSDLDAYATRLTNDADELRELIETVIVPETFFFREPAALIALTDMVRRRRAVVTVGKPLRVLSVACSSGEEPYSIAIALIASGCSPDAIRVDGLDVSRVAVQRARQATYRESSFRGEWHEYREYFVETANGMAVRDDVRARVFVEQGNIVAPHYALPHDSYDVVFCRNLLIYFDSPAQERALAFIARHLRAGGVLFVAAADAFAVRKAGFVPIAIDAACAFRMPDAGAAGTTLPCAFTANREATSTAPTTSRATPLGMRVESSATPRRTRAQTPGRSSANRMASVATEARAANAATSASHLAELANAGRLHEAATLGESAFDSAGADAAFFALLGTVHAARGDADRAEVCYRRAIYLEPRHSDALLHLALLFERQGERAAAARLLTRAQRAASGGAP